MMVKREIEIDVMISAVNFFGKQNFENTTYTEYKYDTIPDMNVEDNPNYVRYEFEHPQTRDLRIRLGMDMFLSTIRDEQMFTEVVVNIDDELLARQLESSEKFRRQAISEGPDGRMYLRGFDVFDHIQRTYGNDIRLDVEEVIMWLRDNEFNAYYMGIPIDEVN